MQSTNLQPITIVEDEYMRQVESFLRKLTPHEEQVIRMRFGIGTTPRHAEAVGRGLGISASMVARIQVRALHRLRMLALHEG